MQVANELKTRSWIESTEETKRSITRKMAEDLNISKSKVTSCEIGRREMSLYDAVIISKYFNVSMENLFNKKTVNS